MVVIQKKKVHATPPSKYVLEKYALDLNEESIFKCGPPVYAKRDIVSERPPLYAISWGWNANGRIGNTTAVEMREPRQVQKSIHHNYIASSAGRNHSLLVADTGNVYSFGEGRHGELGYGNSFSTEHPKGGKVQNLPRQVTPTGICKFGADVKFRQVACGSQFSIAREMCIEEGTDMVRGLRQMEDAVRKLKHNFAESEQVHWAWSNIRDERFRTNRVSEGLLFSWGEGSRGQLGLGSFQLKMSSPQLISKLRHVCITQVCAGANHVLAISDQGNLYSWGSGRSGKLGHGDCKDRFSPQRVMFLLSFFVEHCAAGDEHSAVLVTDRKGLPRSQQLKRVSTFGRGAHGRLGNGTNKSQCLPVLVSKFPLSVKGVQFRQVSCGGAHTLALAEMAVPRCLANPWGRRTFVLAWGYGWHGQLGDGQGKDSFVPVLARLPRCVVLAEVCAGRSWSLARSIGGELFSWGKGLRGQLGLGKTKFSAIPRLVTTFASFVQLSAGLEHNVCISAPKKLFNSAMCIAASEQDDVFAPLVQSGVRQVDSVSALAFACCRRALGPRQVMTLRFMCVTCGQSCVCYLCMRMCHRGHEVVQRRAPAPAAAAATGDTDQIMGDSQTQTVVVSPEEQRRLKLREINQTWNLATDKALAENKKNLAAGLVHRASSITQHALPAHTHRPVKKMKAKKKVQAPPAVLLQVRRHDDEVRLAKNSRRRRPASRGSESASERASTEPASCCVCGLYSRQCRLLPEVPEHTDEWPDSVLCSRSDAARCIQTLARTYIGRRQIRQMKEFLKEVRHEVCTKHYNNSILSPIMAKIARALAYHREEQEERIMVIEDDTKHKFDYNYYLQGCIGGMAAMSYGVKKLLAIASPAVPRIRQLANNDESQDYFSYSVSSDASRPSLAFSWTSLRQLQLWRPFACRVSPAVLALLSRDVPRFSGSREGLYYDPDVNLFSSKYLKDAVTQGLRNDEARAKALAAEESRKRAEKALAQLNAQRNGVKMLLARADALTKPPAPPAGAPPQWMIIAAARQLRREKRRAIRHALEAAEQAEDAADDAPFNMYSIEPEQPLRRRHSISDPTELYARVTEMGPQLQLINFARRRNSLPVRVEQLSAAELPVSNSWRGARQSLSLFDMRRNMIEEFSRPEQEHVWVDLQPKHRRKLYRQQFGHVWLSPRLPREMLQLLQDGGRRRTVGEPERLAHQLFLLFEVRNACDTFFGRARRSDHINRRMRSFDLGEQQDISAGFADVLGYEFEEQWKLPTMTELERDARDMDSRIIFSGFINRPDDLPAVASSGSAEYSSVAAQRSSDAGVTTGQDNTAGAVSCVVWQEYTAEDGSVYFYNPASLDSSWTLPEGPNNHILSQYQDDDGNWYWYNNTTGETSWS